MQRIIFVSALLLLAASLPGRAEPRWAQGQIYSGNIDIGGVQVPLPSGDWVVTGIENSSINAVGNGIETNVGLAQIIDGKVRAYTSINYNQQALRSSSGWKLPAERSCTRPEIHFAEIKRNQMLRKTCAYVNHIALYVSATSPKWWLDSVGFAKKNSIAMPLAVIQSGIVVSDRQNFVAVGYYFNPESVGFAPPSNTAWETSDWNALNITRDKEKQAFVQSIIAWTEKATASVEAGLAGKLDASSNLDWPTAMQ